MLATNGVSAVSMPNVFGLLSLCLTVAAYTWYLYDTFRKGARPHVLTWLAFGGFTAVGWLVQVQESAGPGAWAMGVTWVSCFIVSGASAWKQHVEEIRWWRFRWQDWTWVSLAVVVFLVYFQTHGSSPATAAVCATLADLLSYCPTINQALKNPHRDSTAAYFLNAVKFIPSLASLYFVNAFTVATALYPAAVLTMNLFMVYLLTQGRRARRVDEPLAQ
jgi:hypothetical protein